ncbi:hypothetical protein B9479_005730 [Cryptococcus floricola]|uniref:Uncharacterized protein n=1 Tax=Cryptococcus floricola TaxID=2591691 RepID=A0A5D3ATZ3_9TREE|nr:hypothetical protein B9479_005730 [Cryptococcus floricola]
MSTTFRSLSPMFLILILLLVLVFMTAPADASMAPVYMHYYCRQQCDSTFRMCAMGASCRRRFKTGARHICRQSSQAREAAARSFEEFLRQPRKPQSSSHASTSTTSPPLFATSPITDTKPRRSLPPIDPSTPPEPICTCPKRERPLPGEPCVYCGLMDMQRRQTAKRREERQKAKAARKSSGLNEYPEASGVAEAGTSVLDSIAEAERMRREAGEVGEELVRELETLLKRVRVQVAQKDHRHVKELWETIGAMAKKLNTDMAKQERAGHGR